ncbi:uncharacterized protein LOC142887376 isoform X3 [Nelusetta ayraudi]|uniref:uncharacterized protein LOC142887376 isoform X3 n=1 Tax=Nelusetta ayraudi TaxID=303726 RepID=UPI003F6F757D
MENWMTIPYLYENPPVVPTSAPWVQTNSGPPPVGPSYVDPHGTEIMYSQPELPFSDSSQDCFIPQGQYWAQYLSPATQYPGSSWAAPYNPGPGPAEYSAYAGSYYAAQTQSFPFVQPTAFLLFVPQQVPSQAASGSKCPPKRERKLIRIRDPNQGGRDITEEIMSGVWSATAKDAPQSSTADTNPEEINSEVLPVTTEGTKACAEEIVEVSTAATVPPPPVAAITEPLVEVQQEVETTTSTPPPPESPAQSEEASDAAEVQPLPTEDEQTPSAPPPPAESQSPPAEATCKADALDTGDQRLAPEGVGCRSCVKGVRSREHGLQQLDSACSTSFPSTKYDHKASPRSSSQRACAAASHCRKRNRNLFDQFNRRAEGQPDRDPRNSWMQICRRSFLGMQEEGGRAGDLWDPTRPVLQRVSVAKDRDRGGMDVGSGDKCPTADPADKYESAISPPLPKPALTKEEVEELSHVIIKEYLYSSNLKRALLCVKELNSASLLYVLVQRGIEMILKRRTIARERIGLLLYHLVKEGSLPAQQFYKGLEATLDTLGDTAIDLPDIWFDAAELITPMLYQGGIPMGQLFRKISKHLLPTGQAALLLAEIIKLLCRQMSPKRVGAMWAEAGLSWSDFLPDNVDINKFVTEQKVEFTLGYGTDSSDFNERRILTEEELKEQLDLFLLNQVCNQQIEDWIETYLDEAQISSNRFVRALMTSVCQSVMSYGNRYELDTELFQTRASLLQKYLCDEQKELQALYALQTLMVDMEHPTTDLLRLFFEALYDEDVIGEDTFYKWKSSKDPAELRGKVVALRSVMAFFTWLIDLRDSFPALIFDEMTLV